MVVVVVVVAVIVVIVVVVIGVVGVVGVVGGGDMVIVIVADMSLAFYKPPPPSVDGQDGDGWNG